MKRSFTLLAVLLLVLVSGRAFAQITGDTSVCAGETETYFANQVPGATYSWIVTGALVSGSQTADSLVVSFPVPGNAFILVTVNTPNSGIQTYSLNIVIHPVPQPIISHLPYPTCPPEGGENSGAGNPDHGGKDVCEKVCEWAVITYSTPNNPGSTYSWTATGAASVTGAGTNTVTVSWDNSPLGSLTVYETNQWGCVDSATICVEKMPLPTALFSHPLNVCKFSTVPFTNLSTGATSWLWNFGDNTTSGAFSPTHSYSVAGTYTVTLIAISDCFCSDTFQSQITVDSLPGPDISCPSTLCAFDTATYTTSVSGCTYSWVVQGGTISGPSNQQSVTVIWGAGQMGSLGLIVSGCGSVCSDTTWVQIPIIPANGVISGPAKVCPGECETFSLPLFNGAKYTWSLNSGACGTISDSTCCNTVEICWPPFAGPCNDTLTVTFWDAFLNCGGSAKMIIRLRPKLDMFGQQEACANGNSNFFAFPGVPCTWNVSPAGPIFNPGPSPNTFVNWNGLTGTFTVTAIPANPNAVCNDSVKRIVTVVAAPPAPQISGDTITCANSAVQYCANGTGVVNWLITGGTPLNATGNCVTVIWGNTPPYLVKAFVNMPSSPYCTSDTTVQNITVINTLPQPVINGPAIACANGTSNFSCPTPYPPGASWFWYLNPGNSGTILTGQGSPSVQVEWGNNAPQTVQLTLVVSVCGIKDSSIVSVTLNPAPNPVINQIGNLCPGSPAQLNVTGGVFTAYTWSGPGGFTGNTNPVTITQNGLYQVTVTDAGNCTAITQYTAFYAGVPVASITSQHPLTYCIGTPISVTLCALGNPSYTYAWSNGPTGQCNTVNTPGSYTVTVTDNTNGCQAVSNMLSVNVIPCQPDTGQCIPDGQVSFTHSSCNPKIFTSTSTNAGSFFWTFGDFGTSTLANPTHLYNQAGFFLVNLSAKVPNTSGTDSCVLSAQQLIEIPLLARFNFTYGCNGAPVCFNDMSVTTAGNSITSWNWNFGDATTSTLQNPCHTYAGPGTYIVTLTISNPNCTTSFSDTVVIAPPPVAAFSIGSGNCVNSAIAFTDNSTGGVNYWNWNFGNGGTSLNQNPSQAYGLPGTYTVTLIVKDTAGCSDTVQQNILINAPLVSGSIAAFPDTIVCLGTPVTLSAPACGTCTYLWSTGSVNDSITVTSTGLYFVTVYDANGCAWTDHQLVIVNSGPQASITSTKNHLCLGEFATLSVPYSINWLYTWISNDPGVNGNTFPSVNFFPASPGLYTFEVVITDTTTGCSDTTLLHAISVHLPPVPPVITSIGSSVVCQGDTVQLVVTHPDPNVTFSWNTGAVNDTIQVTKDGCYTVIVTDTNGCTSQTTFCVTVNPLPELCTFYTGCFDTCAPYTILGPAGAASYQWLLNGLPIPGATSQNYTASVSGSYSVILTTAFGCVDTTGNLNLNLYPCGDTLCASLVIDSVACDPTTGMYVMTYYVINNSPFPVSQINLQVLPPHLNIAYAPNMVFVNLPPGDTSLPLTTLIYNGMAGDTLCFRTHIEAYDDEGNELLCCESDTFCVVLPECNHVELPCLCDQSLMICEDDTAYFQYFIYDPNTTYTWQFPGGIPAFATGMGPHAVYYPNPGVYPVQLIMTNAQGDKICTDSIYVQPKPIAAIVPSGNLLLAQPAGMSYQWYTAPVGPGNAIPGAVNQFFTPAGTGTYCVVVSNPIGCADTVCIYYESPDTSCCYFSYGGDSVWCEQGPAGDWVYHFSIQISGCGNLNVSPINFGPFTINYPLVMTGGLYTITGTFMSPTDSVLCLTFVVNDSTHYCADQTICIALPDCQPHIQPCDNLTANFGMTVSGFTGSFSDLSIATGGMVIIGWSWNFGDPASGINNTSALPNPVHVFSGPGTYNVCMIVIGMMPNGEICAKMYCHPVVIMEEPNPCDSISVQFGFTSNLLNVSFTDMSTVPAPLVISSWSWNFDDIPSGANNFSNLQNPTHVFTTSGWYFVCLTVTAVHPLDPTIFCENKFCQKIFVEGPPVDPCDSLMADFSFTTNGLTASFTDLSYAGGGLVISNYFWNFGDPASGVNNTSILANPVHTFTGTGFYTVCLIVAAKDNFNNHCYDTICKEIFVEGPEPDPCDSLFIHFTALGNGWVSVFNSMISLPPGFVVFSYAWNFGDPASGANNSSTLPNPVHQFTANGYYQVCLTVTIINSVGASCERTICRQIYISRPHVDVGVDIEILTGGSAQLGAVVSGGTPPYTWEWMPFDGLSDPLIPDPVASPGQTTTYVLLVTDSLGYSDTDTLVVTVLPILPASLSGNLLYTGNNQPLNNASLLLTDANGLTEATTSGASGEYSFQNLYPGTYSLTGSTQKAWGGVNATDALLILKHFVGSSPLSGIQLEAADVDATNYVNSADALACMRRFVGLIPSFPTGDWVFETPVVSLSAGESRILNLSGMCYGDVNVSYNPPSAKPEPTLSLIREGTLNLNPSEVLPVPIRIREASEISAISLVLNFPSDMIEIVDVKGLSNGSDLVWNVIGNELRIAWCSLSINALANEDAILTLYIRIKNNNVSDSESIRFELNAESSVSDPLAHTLENRTLLIPNILASAEQLKLSQNVPNPFSEYTLIRYTLPQDGIVRLSVFNALGEEVAVLADGYQPSGAHQLKMLREDLVNGFYYYKLEFSSVKGNSQKIRQMIIMD